MARRQDLNERPNTLPWPPLIFAGAAAAAVLLDRLHPVSNLLPDGGAVRAIGAIVLLVGLCLDGAAMLTMRRHHANILPHRAATALVTTGVFAVSRNPIYLGNTLLLAGAALVFGNPWLLLSAVAAAGVVTKLAIRREEAHLAARFGDAWQVYAARTGRWLGF